MRRSLSDLSYRLAIAWRGPAYWHWRYYGWEYRAQRTADGWDARMLGRNYRFRSVAGWQPSAGTIHIVLSGPSVGRLSEPARLASQPTIAVNGSYRILTAAGCRADLYVVSDVGFVRRQWATFVDGVNAARAVALDHRVVLEVARRDPSLLTGRDVLLFDNLTRPYRRSAHWWAGKAGRGVAHRNRDCAFSMAADLGYFPSCTVAYLALQIAATQRPARIVFFGLDLNGGRFYAESTPEKSMLGQDFERCILPHFGFASQVLAQAGIEVLNASPDSALPDSVFRRVDPASHLAGASAATAAQA